MMAEYAEALKRNGIDYDGAMERFGGNAALYERLALKFLDDAHFAALEQALADGDVDAAVREDIRSRALQEIFRSPHCTRRRAR